jgi:predicted heme/steroid binding protein
VIARQEARQIQRPTHLIPFQVDQHDGARQLQDWLAQGWMHPPGLRQAAASARLNGVYLPFWIFSARLSTSWQAEVGQKRTRSTWDGKRKTEIKWKKQSGRLNLKISDMLTPGTNKISAPLLQRLYPFELSALTVYDPAYLAGWQAQVYDVGLRPAWDQARNWMRQQAKAAVHRKINSRHGRNSSVRNFGMTADLQDERWRYVLLPVYLSAYRFNGQTYQVMVNGQTGKAAGQKPLDWRRVGGALAGLLLPGLLLTALSRLLPQDLAGCSCMLGLTALTIGLALAWRVLQQARAVDKIA